MSNRPSPQIMLYLIREAFYQKAVKATTRSTNIINQCTIAKRSSSNGNGRKNVINHFQSCDDLVLNGYSQF